MVKMSTTSKLWTDARVNGGSEIKVNNDRSRHRRFTQSLYCHTRRDSEAMCNRLRNQYGTGFDFQGFSVVQRPWASRLRPLGASVSRGSSTDVLQPNQLSSLLYWALSLRWQDAALTDTRRHLRIKLPALFMSKINISLD